MTLSIVIVNYKSFPQLQECLAALQSHAPGFPYEIIVIDNASNQDNEETLFLRTWEKHIRYIQNSANEGFGKASNKATKEAKGQYLLFINPDVVVWEKSLEKAVEYFEKHKEVGIVGGQLRYADGTIQDSYRTFPRIFDQIIKRIPALRSLGMLRKRVSHYLMWHKDPEKTEPVDWVVGGFLFARKKAFDQIGGFDPRYFLFMEDVDLCRHMWQLGLQVVYYPEVKATHARKRLSAGGIAEIFTNKNLRIHLRSAVQYFRKYLFQKHPR